MKLPLSTPILLLAMLVACVPGSCAVYLARIPVWEHRWGGSFTMEEGVTGSWNPSWEDRGTANRRSRIVQVDLGTPVPNDASVADVFVRVVPSSAITERAKDAEPSSEWTRIRPLSRSYDFPLVIDPPSVQRIDYRVGAVAPELRGRSARLFVNGRPDSEYPEDSWFFVAATLGIVALGATPMMLELRGRRLARDSAAQLRASANP